jgi:hypothetical protein
MKKSGEDEIQGMPATIQFYIWMQQRGSKSRLEKVA